MKWKNITIFAAYFVGIVHGIAVEEQYNETINDAKNCDNICSKVENIDLKKRCKCPFQKLDRDLTLSSYPKLVPLIHKRETNVQYVEGGNKIKRQTIQDLINKRNKINKKTPTTLALFSTQKLQPKSKTSLLRNHKQAPSLKELEERLKDLRTRLSIKPKFQSRGAFSETENSKNLMKQLKDRREEIMKDLKTLHSRSGVGKDSTLRKEIVGSIHSLQNRIDNVGSSLKEKLKEKVDERKSKDKGLAEGKEEKKEIVGAVKKQSTTTEMPRPASSSIPEIVLGKTGSKNSKTETIDEIETVRKSKETENIESSSKKSVTLEKIKEKQKETLMKIKDKLRNNSKNLEVVDDNKLT